MSSIPLVSIVIPVYFNSQSLPFLADRLRNLRDSNREFNFEFIFVDDGSKDDSYRIIADLVASDSSFRAVKLSRNFGTYVAIIAGMNYAKGDCVACLAADLQDPPDVIPEMLAYWKEGNKAVLAVRKDRKGDPVFTRLWANLFNTLYKRYVFNGFSPQGVGFFLIDRQVVEVILSSDEKNTNIVGLILWTGFKYATVLYDRPKRIHGKSRWTFSKKFTYFLDSFIAFSFLPVRISTILGLMIAFIGCLYAIWIIIARLIGKVPVEGWSATMVAILVLSGVQLTILGVLGEYLWRNFDSSRKRPMFIVESSLPLCDKSENLDENNRLLEEIK